MPSILLYCRLPIKEKTKVLTCFFYLYSFTGVKHLLITSRHLVCPKYESSAYSNVYCLLNKRIWKLCPNFVLILLLNLRISIGHNIHSPMALAWAIPEAKYVASSTGNFLSILTPEEGYTAKIELFLQRPLLWVAHQYPSDSLSILSSYMPMIKFVVDNVQPLMSV